MALTNGLRDIKPPVEIPTGWAWVGWAVTLLVLTVAAWWASRKWKHRPIVMPPTPVIPPHVRARQRLADALTLLGKPKEFCVVVSETLRIYLEERFTFHAPDRTTEEFLAELRASDLLSLDQKLSLAQFLEKCDLVKFARYEPGEPELRDLHASAVQLVDQTEPVPESASPPVAATDLTAGVVKPEGLKK